MAEAAIEAGGGAFERFRMHRARAHEGMPTESCACPRQELGVSALAQGRQRVFAAPRPLESVPSPLDLATDVPRLPGDTDGVFRVVVVWLELVVGKGPVGDR